MASYSDPHLPVAVAATKVDKLSRGRLPERFAEIIGTLDLPPETPFIPTSARLGQGGREMRAWVEALLAAAEAEAAGADPEADPR